MSSEEMKQAEAAIPEEEEAPYADDECSVADIIEGRISKQDNELKEDEKDMSRSPPERAISGESTTSSTLSEKRKQGRGNEKVLTKLSTTSSTSSTGVSDPPAFPTSLSRAHAGIVASPGAIAVPGFGGDVANQAPPLASERSSYMVQAELVLPDTTTSSDVEQGNPRIVSDSAAIVVKAQAMNEIDPKEPNFWDLLKLKSVRIALLVILVLVIALAVGMAVGLSTNGNASQAAAAPTAAPIIVNQEDDESGDV
jgi:hypothetical protein